MSSPLLTFLTGLLALILFFWYLATDFSRRKRILGTALTLLMLWICGSSIYPPKEKIRLGLDLQGGTSFLIRLMKEDNGQVVNKAVLDQAVEVIRKRIDTFGVSEPVITPEGNDRILVQIPGMDADKIAEAREQLAKVAKLEFRLVHPQSEQLIAKIEAGQEPVPPGYRIEEEKETRGGKAVSSKLLVRTKADIEGKYVTKGVPTFDQQGWGVALEFNSVGADLFGKLTADHVNERFAIVLDGEIQSAPVIRGAIYGGRASITGNFTEPEARGLASVLENPLAVPVKIEEERSASATLGASSVKSGIYAGIGGLLLVIILVMVYYGRVAGSFAVLALLVNMVLLLGAMSMFNFVLTLPGIAGIILTIGLAVDANVLIFERLREELAAGKSFPAAIDGAYSKAFSVIFDANATTLITAAILFWKAAGPVKGFAITLTMGVIASVFTAMIVSRNCFDWAISSGRLKGVNMMHLISDKMNINFMGRRRLWIGISILVIVATMSVFVIRGEKNFGIDFKGGDLLMLQVDKSITEAEIRNQVGKIGFADAVIQKESDAASRTEYIAIRSPIDSAEKIQEQLTKTLPKDSFKISKIDRVGKVVGGELARSSTIALLLGMLGIFIFVSARFEFSFAIGALVAVLHDVIITIGLFALFGRELSLVMVGAILTIAGYSINDTIVVFDRIREGLHSGRKGTTQEIMNASINETLSRTLLTSGLTFLSVAALYVFGGPVLQDFAVAIMIGIVVGTYSSIFVASPIVLWWSRRGGRSLATEVKKAEPTIQA